MGIQAVAYIPNLLKPIRISYEALIEGPKDMRNIKKTLQHFMQNELLEMFL